MRLDAEKAPFFINKLAIKVLPTMITFIDGVKSDEIVGFEELGGQDDFPTINLTRRLVRTGILTAKGRQEKGHIKIKKGKGRQDSSDEDS